MEHRGINVRNQPLRHVSEAFKGVSTMICDPTLRNVGVPRVKKPASLVALLSEAPFGFSFRSIRWSMILLVRNPNLCPPKYLWY